MFFVALFSGLFKGGLVPSGPYSKSWGSGSLFLRLGVENPGFINSAELFWSLFPRGVYSPQFGSGILDLIPRGV